MSDISYRIMRSSRRETLSIEVTREARVVARAPLGLSEARIHTFVLGHQAWILKKLEEAQKNLEKYPNPSEEEWEILSAQAAEIIPPKVEQYARQMGAKPRKVKITRARTRFGSCSGKNCLSFSALLMRYPEAAIDYVVVHELAHIFHKNHGPEFWQAVETVFPDYKARRRLLRG